MATITVTEVSEELLRLLDQRIRSRGTWDRADYIRELLQRDLLPAAPERPGWPSSAASLTELLAPVQAEAAALGETEEETASFLREQLAAHRREHRAALQPRTPDS